MPLATPERIALEGIQRMKQFFKGLGLPASLGEMHIPMTAGGNGRQATKDGL